MILLLIFLFALTNIHCAILDYRKRHPFFFIWLYNIPFILIPVIFEYITGFNHDYQENFLLFAILCNSTYLVSSLALRTKKINYIIFIERKKINDGMMLIFLIISSTLMILTVFKNTNNILNPQRDFTTFVLLYSLILFAGYAPYSLKNNRKIFFLIVVLFITYVAMFKSRGALGYMVIPFVYFYLITTKITIRKITILFILLFAMVFLSVGIKSYRWATGSQAFNLDIFLLIMDYNFSILFEKGDLSLNKISYQVMETCYTTSNCGNWADITPFMSLFSFGYIERELGSSYQAWNIFKGSSNVGGSLHLLSYGVSFFDGHWLGLIYFFFLSILRVLTSILMSRTNSIFILGSILYFCLFFSRGSIYNGIMPLIAAILISTAIHFLPKKNRFKH